MCIVKTSNHPTPIPTKIFFWIKSRNTFFHQRLSVAFFTSLGPGHCRRNMEHFHKWHIFLPSLTSKSFAATHSCFQITITEVEMKKMMIFKLFLRNLWFCIKKNYDLEFEKTFLQKVYYNCDFQPTLHKTNNKNKLTSQ